MARRTVPLSDDSIEDAIFGSVRSGNLPAASTTGWVSMADFERVRLYVKLVATWTAGDVLNTCQLQQAQDSTGTGAKDLTTTGGAATDYTTADATGMAAAGNEVRLDCLAERMDTNNGFTYVRGYCASTGNTGVDDLIMVTTRYCSRYPQKQKAGAAAAGKVYGPHNL